MRQPLNRAEKLFFTIPLGVIVGWGAWHLYERIRPFDVSYEDGWYVSDMAFSPDGERLAVHVADVAVDTSPNGGGGYWRRRFEIRDSHSGRFLAECDLPRVPQWSAAPVWSPDGKQLLATLSDDAGSTQNQEKYSSTIAAWNSYTGELQNNVMLMGESQSDMPVELKFMPDNRLAVIGQSVEFLDAASLQFKQKLPWKDRFSTQIQVNPAHNLGEMQNYRDMQSVLTAKSQTRLWNLKTGKFVRTLPLNWVQKAAWSQSGDELAVLQAHDASWPRGQSGQLSLWNYDGTRRLWNAPFKDCRFFVWSPTAQQFGLNRAQISTEIVENRSKENPANHLQSSSVEWWNSAQKKRMWSHPLSGWLETMKVSADGRWLLGIEWYARSSDISKRKWDEILWVWNTQTGAVRLRRVTERVNRLKWSPQGSRLVISVGQKLEMLDFSE